MTRPLPARARWKALPGPRTLLACCIAWAVLAACGTSPPEASSDARAALAPAGRLRVGVYPGSPTSLIRGSTADDSRGVSVEIGRELARRLGVPAELVVLERADEVVQALKAGRADVTVTNASPARARDLDFTAPLIGIELGYLVMPGSPVTSIDTADRAGNRIGVSQGSSSQAALTRAFAHAVIVPAASLQAAAELLERRGVDAFATNKAILFEMADTLPGARVLDGRWGVERLAIAVPKGRDVGMPYLQRFADDVRRSGAVQQAAQRAGLRGTTAIDGDEPAHAKP